MKYNPYNQPSLDTLMNIARVMQHTEKGSSIRAHHITVKGAMAVDMHCEYLVLYKGVPFVVRIANSLKQGKSRCDRITNQKEYDNAMERFMQDSNLNLS